MSLEPVTTWFVRRYLRRLEDGERSQRALLARILRTSAGSPCGRALGLNQGMPFEEFLHLPPRDFGFYSSLVERVLDGDRHAFGHDPVVALAETSGTTGPPKLIPHTEPSLARFGHFSRVLLLFQLRQVRNCLPAFTRWLLITACTATRDERGVPVGFISGLMAHRTGLSRYGFTAPSLATSAVADWNERVRRTAGEALGLRIGTLFGVPAYLVQFLRVAAALSRRPLKRVWPRLTDVFYSGTPLGPHRAEIEEALGRPVQAWSMYVSSEGAFGAELDRDGSEALRLLPELTVLTFRPLDAVDGPLLPLWSLQPGLRYAVHITTLAGLVQYPLGDVVEVVTAAPLRVRLAGRVGQELNLATEKLSAGQATAAVAALTARHGVRADHFVVLPDPTHPRRHLWLLEATATAGPRAAPAEELDRAVARGNPSYAALRDGNAVPAPPRVVVLPAGSFEAYLRAGYARRGQFKFRHLFPSADPLLKTPGLDGLAPHLAEAPP